MVESLKEINPTRSKTSVHTLWNLDTQAIANVLDQIGDLSAALFVGISQSGTTMETLSLMNTLRDTFDHVGLDPCNHFVWITESKDTLDAQVQTSIETFDESLKRHQWKEINAIRLTFGEHKDINALFCVPHSVPFFLALALLLDNQVEEVGKICQEYRSLRKGLDHISLLEAAESLAAMHNPETIQIDIEECISPAANDLITQLIAQALGSKQDNFNPRVHIGKLTEITKHKSGVLQLALPMPEKASKHVKLMLSMNSVTYFVAMPAYHKEINFVIHPKVNIYKKRAMELLASKEEQHPAEKEIPSVLTFNAEDIVAHLQSNSSARFVDVIYFGPSCDTSSLSGMQDVITTCLREHEDSTEDIRITAYHGSRWIHSRYRAAVQMKNTLRVVVTEQSIRQQIPGIPLQRLKFNLKLTRCIAYAVYESLKPNSICFKLGS